MKHSEAPNGRADLTPHQYAALRQISMATVYRRISDGHVDAYKVGAATRITLDSIEREVENNRVVFNP